MKLFLNLHNLWLKTLFIVLIALTIIAFTMRGATDDGRTLLKGPPIDGGIFFIGNSMFGTGLDLQFVQSAFPESSSTFAYYDGYYTSMWYSAIRNGLLPSGAKPKIVVWGFRPTYAVYPAFRQNKTTDLDLFLDTDDPEFRRILANAEDPIYRLSAEPATEITESPILSFVENSPALNQRQSFQDHLTKSLYSLALKTSAHFSNKAQKLSIETTETKLSDLIISFVTDGRIKRADAMVIDNGEQFVKGVERSLDQSFILKTQAMLAKNEIPQLIIIFKPRSVLEGIMPDTTTTFYEEAIRYFDQNNVSYIDFIADEALSREYYAVGDHYNANGMRYITEHIIKKLQAMEIEKPASIH